MRRADESQVRQGLGEISDLNASSVEFFGEEPERASVADAFFELELGFIEAAGPCQAFGVPERTGRERALFSLQSIVVAVPVDQPVIAQVLADGIEGGKPDRIGRRDEAHQRQQQE
jgi:hypothetical protein